MGTVRDAGKYLSVPIKFYNYKIRHGQGRSPLSERIIRFGL